MKLIAEHEIGEVTTDYEDDGSLTTDDIGGDDD